METNLTAHASTIHASAARIVQRLFLTLRGLLSIAFPQTPSAEEQISRLDRRWMPKVIGFIVIAISCSSVLAQDKRTEGPSHAKNSILRAKSSTTTSISDATLAVIAQRVTTAVDAVQAAPGKSGLTPKQKQNLVELQERSGSAVDIKLRPGNGAVRQLKGRMLHRFEQSDAATARSFFRANRELLKIHAPDEEFTLSSSETDGFGRRHLRFDQRYRGLPVWPAQALVHLDPYGNVDLVNGAYVPTPSDSGNAITPVIDLKGAIRKARPWLPGADSTTPSKAELIFYATEAGVARLGWKLELSIAPDEQWLVVIDAVTGAKLTSYNKVAYAGVSGSGVDLHNITRPLPVFLNEGNSTFYMVNTRKMMYDPTSTPPPPSSTRGGIIVEDFQHTPAGDGPGTVTFFFVTSGNANSGWLPDAVSAAYGLSEVYDYYLERHQRNSFDGKGGTILGMVRYRTGYDNAFWNGSYITFGDAKPWAGALDLVGHEMTHAVTEKTANLEYKDQSGALNEAFSDIFGEAVEARTRGGNDWLMGAELGSPVRNLKDPHSVTYNCGVVRAFPATMSEFVPANDASLAKCKDSDNGGVHVNSSIINHAFYLLAEGLPAPIGLYDAERIFYRALTLHLAPQSQFIDARLAAVAAADELFGAGSPQSRATGEAFDAVEIFDNSPTAPPPTVPVVLGDDSTLFLFYDDGWRIGRRETALGDGVAGNFLLDDKTVSYERVAVNGVGTFAAVVSSDKDLCLVNTDGSNLTCIGFPNSFHAVAMSPSAQKIALVLLGSEGHPENKIRLLDLPTESSQTITLQAGATDAQSTDTIDHADVMTFDFRESRLFYDAVSFGTASDGSSLTTWSIYALDIASGSTLSILPSIPGVNVGNPALGHVHDDLLALDAFDRSTGNSTIHVLNLTTNKLQAVAQTGYGYGFPSFLGDDSSVVFSRYDAFVPSFRSLYRQPLGADSMTPLGASIEWLRDGDVATMYRRGTYASGTAVVQ